MHFAQVFVCGVLIICLHGGMGLKCRTGGQETNDQFQRVMRRCRDRVLQGGERIGNGNSSEDDSNDDENYNNSEDESTESDERDFDRKFGNTRTGTTDTSMMRNSGSNYNNDQKSNSRRYEQHSTTRPYPYNKIMSNTSHSGNNDTEDRLLRNKTNLRNGGGMANTGQYDMQTSQQDQACVIQCFFDELKLVDKNGFPEKSAVTKVMMQSIQDQDLQDFVEEAVMDCFYLIDADRNKEQCRYSQNLLTCLASKGRQRCEDWD